MSDWTCMKCGRINIILTHCEYCGTKRHKPAPPPASLGDEECTPEQLAYGRKVVVLDWLQWGIAWDENKAALALKHMAYLEASRAELVAEVERLKQECDEWEGSCSRQYSEITKYRAALTEIQKRPCNGKMGCPCCIAREALGAGKREGV